MKPTRRGRRGERRGGDVRSKRMMGKPFLSGKVMESSRPESNATILDA